MAKKGQTTSRRKPKLDMEWQAPLLRILEGHDSLLSETSSFPRLGKLPALGEIREVLEMGVGPGQYAAGCATVIVVVVVIVAVAARPGGITSEEMLRAKLLDVYSPKEREALREAAAAVRQNPGLVKSALGISYEELGKDFMGGLKQVEKALA